MRKGRDDGLPWRDIGDGVRKCQIQDFELTSILVKTMKNSAGWPMDLYELKVVEGRPSVRQRQGGASASRS